MHDTVIIDTMRWHQICHELNLDEMSGANGRKEAFEECFNCTVTWKSRVDQWPGKDVSERPNPVMVLRFLNPSDSILFALKYL